MKKKVLKILKKIDEEKSIENIKKLLTFDLMIHNKDLQEESIEYFFKNKLLDIEGSELKQTELKKIELCEFSNSLRKLNEWMNINYKERKEFLLFTYQNNDPNIKIEDGIDLLIVKKINEVNNIDGVKEGLLDYNEFLKRDFDKNKLVLINNYFEILSYSKKLSNKDRLTNINIILNIFKILKIEIESKELNEDGIESTDNEIIKLIINKLKNIQSYIYFDVIPQILGNLNINSKIMFEVIKEIILKISHDFPELILYPIIVGTNTIKGKLIFKNNKKIKR
jgi:hypothetical protein